LRQVAATLLSNDLEAFCREAWPLVESEPFISAKYWSCLCEHLMAVSIGRIKRLTIAMPPRFGKSTLISTLWPCWEWARNGGSNCWIFASYSQDLAVRDSVRRRNVFESGWYRYLWPQVQLSADMNLKTEYTTTNHGAMFSTWPGGALGRGCNGW